MSLQYHNYQVNKDLKRLSKKGLIYLGQPYSSNSDEVMNWRYEKSCEFAAMFHESGLNWFSPISMSHRASEYLTDEVKKDWKAWEKLDLYYASLSSCLVICALNNWRESTGLTAEIEYFERAGKPIFYLNPDNNKISLFQRSNIFYKTWHKITKGK